jgi:hypothetical protein
MQTVAPILENPTIAQTIIRLNLIKAHAKEGDWTKVTVAVAGRLLQLGRLPIVFAKQVIRKNVGQKWTCFALVPSITLQGITIFAKEG